MKMEFSNLLLGFNLYPDIIPSGQNPLRLNDQTSGLPMHSSATLQSPPSVLFFCLCDKVHRKHEVRFLLYLLGQIVIWQYNPYPLDEIDHALFRMIMIDSCRTVSEGIGSVVKHSTADLGIASSTPLSPTKNCKMLPCISALHWAR